MNDKNLFINYIKNNNDEEFYNTLNDNQKLEYEHKIINTFDFAFYRLNYYIKELKNSIIENFKG